MIDNYIKAIVSVDMTTEVEVDELKLRTVGFLSKNQLDGSLLDLASIACGYTTVPL